MNQTDPNPDSFTKDTEMGAYNNRQAEDTPAIQQDQTAPEMPDLSNRIAYACFLLIVWLCLVIYAVVFCLSFLASVGAIPLLLIALPVTRCLQFIRDGDGFDRAVQLKYVIFTVIITDTTFILLPCMGVFFPIAKFTPSLKHAMIIGLHLTTWVRIICMICGFCLFLYSFALFSHGVLLQQLLNKRGIVCNIYVREAVTEMVGCLICWWAFSDVVKSVPAFEQHQLLGFHTRRWIVAAFLTLMGHDAITLCTHISAWLLREGLQKLEKSKTGLYTALVEILLDEKGLVYYAYGLRRSISFILTSVLMLLVWVLYFGSHLKGTVTAERAVHFGTRTLVSFLICSLLWLIKDCILLAWEAKAIYERLESVILGNARKLYFLGLLGRHKYDFLMLLYEDNSKKGCYHRVLECIGKHNEQKFPGKDQEDHWCKGSYMLFRKAKTAKDRLLYLPDQERTPTIYDIKKVARRMLRARHALSKKEYVSDILNSLKSKQQKSGSNEEAKVDQPLVDLVKHLVLINIEQDKQDGSNSEQGQQDRSNSKQDEQEWSRILKEFPKMLDPAKGPTSNGGDTSTDDTSEQQINNTNCECLSEERLRECMEYAQQMCLFVGNLVKSGKDAVECLNTIICVVIICAIFVIWLLITGLASTKLFVLIASPLLGASFIFGETCKNFFQGIVFVYVMRPFDVGDTCNIGQDELELRVKYIGVWGTTFTVTKETDQEVIYPNSELAKLRVINHKIKFEGVDNKQKKKNQSNVSNAESSEKSPSANQKAEIQQS